MTYTKTKLLTTGKTITCLYKFFLCSSIFFQGIWFTISSERGESCVNKIEREDRVTERNIQIPQIAGVAYLVKKHIELVLHFCQSCQTLDPSSLALLTKEIVCRSFNRRRKLANINQKVTSAAACFFRPRIWKTLYIWKTITSHYLAEVLTYIPDQLKETATQISVCA